MPWKAIAALADNLVIGAAGKIPWRLPEDLKFFKTQTTGHTVLMGRKTWDSLGRPLPNRRNLILSRSLAAGVDTLPGAIVVPTLDAVDTLPPAGDVWVIGGAEIYALALPRCTELYLTHVPGNPDGDAFFPPYKDLFTPVETVRTTPEFLIVRYVPRAPAPVLPA
jgi:dihydrofolate reductase